MDKTLFLQHLNSSLKKNSFQKMTLSKNAGADQSLLNIYIRPVEIKKQIKTSWVWHYKTRDVTQNVDLDAVVNELDPLLGSAFLSADLYTTEATYTLLFNKKREAKLLQKKPEKLENPALSHDRVKKRTFAAAGATYLHALGISNAKGEVLKEGQKKYRQIDKYIEIIDSVLRKHPLSKQPHIVDMGSGKGYLTFALFDFLSNSLQLDATVTGIELRQNLVDFCNNLAHDCGFEKLDFQAKDIFEYECGKIDMLIALHACDIATDIAIAKGIQSGAEIIIVAPCCHKQIRKQMQPVTAMAEITRFGIMEERQAELLTDGIRALLMEANGYQVKVLEFVSIEHTPKNMMLIGVKSRANPDALKKMAEIKSAFGIREHYLEKLLESENQKTAL